MSCSLESTISSVGPLDGSFIRWISSETTISTSFSHEAPCRRSESAFSEVHMTMSFFARRLPLLSRSPVEMPTFMPSFLKGCKSSHFSEARARNGTMYMLFFPRRAASRMARYATRVLPLAVGKARTALSPFSTYGNASACGGYNLCMPCSSNIAFILPSTGTSSMLSHSIFNNEAENKMFYNVLQIVTSRFERLYADMGMRRRKLYFLPARRALRKRLCARMEACPCGYWCSKYCSSECLFFFYGIAGSMGNPKSNK